MAALKLLLYNSLIILSAITMIIGEYDSHSNVQERLPVVAKPMHYNISLHLRDIHRNVVFEGKCTILIQILHETRNISLHAQKPYLTIHESSAILSDINETHTQYTSYTIKNYTYNNENQIFAFHFADILSPDYYKLYVEFTSYNYSGASFFKTPYINEEGDTKSVIATHFQPTNARRMFPCWDEPLYRATFYISVKHPHIYKALSNMPIKQIQRTNTTHVVRTHFQISPAMPTYLVAIMLSEFPRIPALKINVRYRHQQLKTHMTFAKSIIENVTLHLESEWKDFVMLPKVDHVALPNFQHDGVENWGLIFYRETAIMYNKEKDPSGHKLNVARLIAREVAHQLSGNRLTSWWSQKWLNEGIAMLFGLDAVNKVLPELHVLDLFVVQIQQESLRFDTHSIMNEPLFRKTESLSEINSLFSFSYYLKAPAILRMLQHILTDKVFRNGIQQYLQKMQLATVDAFWSFMQNALDESNLKYKFNVEEAISSWTKVRHYPILETRQHHKNVVHIELKNFDNPDHLTLWIPMTFTTKASAYFNNTSCDNNTWFRFKPFSPLYEEFKLIRFNESDDWMIINLQQTGYYRINYGYKNWLKLASFLNSNKYSQIHVLNRAQIIDDAFYFLMTDQLNVHIFVQLAKYLWQEMNYVAWYPMIKALEHMSCFFPFPESINIKEQMVDIFDKFHTVVRYKENPKIETYWTDVPENDLMNCLKQETAKWACILGSKKCIEEANSELKLHLAHNKSPLPWWKDWIYCKGLMKDDMQTWNKMFEKYIEESDNTILKSLVCSQDPSFIYSYMVLITIPYKEKISVNDRINIFHSIVARHANNELTSDYILKNLEDIKPVEINVIVALIDIINHMYSEQQLNKITKFVNDLMEEEVTVTVKNIFDSHDRMSYKMYKCMKNVIELPRKIIAFFKHKIEIRLSEIQKQKDYFKKLVFYH